jgi:hypothetical protein
MIDQEEIMAIIIKGEPLEHEVGPYLLEHQNLGSAGMRQETPRLS